jgi:hypothetical protein
MKERYMSNANDGEIGLRHAETGIVLMLNKKERIFIKALLGRVLSSKRSKGVIKKRLGEEYIEIAYRLLETMGENKI